MRFSLEEVKLSRRSRLRAVVGAVFGQLEQRQLMTQLVTFETAGVSSNSPVNWGSQVSTYSVDSGITSTAITRGAGFKAETWSPPANAFGAVTTSASGVFATTQASAVTKGEFYKFTITPASGKLVSISSIDVTPWVQSLQTPINYASIAAEFEVDDLNGSTTNTVYSTASTTITATAGPSSYTNLSLPANTFTATAYQVIVRLVYWKSKDWGHVTFGAYSGGRDVVLNGSVTDAAPAAPAISSWKIDLDHLGNKIDWNNVAGETGYIVDRATNSAFSKNVTTLSSSIAANVTSYDDTNVEPGVRYYYRVRAKNGSAESSNSAVKGITAVQLYENWNQTQRTPPGLVMIPSNKDFRPDTFNNLLGSGSQNFSTIQFGDGEYADNEGAAYGGYVDNLNPYGQYYQLSADNIRAALEALNYSTDWLLGSDLEHFGIDPLGPSNQIKANNMSANWQFAEMMRAVEADVVSENPLITRPPLALSAYNFPSYRFSWYGDTPSQVTAWRDTNIDALFKNVAPGRLYDWVHSPLYFNSYVAFSAGNNPVEEQVELLREFHTPTIPSFSLYDQYNIPMSDLDRLVKTDTQTQRGTFSLVGSEWVFTQDPTAPTVLDELAESIVMLGGRALRWEAGDKANWSAHNGTTASYEDTQDALIQKLSDYVPPVQAPIIVSINSTSSGNTITWVDNADDETGYVVDRATDPAFTKGKASIPLSANVVSYFDDVTDNSTVKYYYNVRAVKSAASSPTSRSVHSTPNLTIEVPDITAVGTTVALPRPIVSWTHSGTGVSSFVVERSDREDFSSNIVQYSVGSSARSFTDGSVLEGTAASKEPWQDPNPVGEEVFYRVRAITNAGVSDASDVLEWN